jgi:hypothetical protein
VGELIKYQALGQSHLFSGLGRGDTQHHEVGQLADSIENADSFAQVFPEHKYHIVDVLKQRGHIVGMTGDGVNDAPALNNRWRLRLKFSMVSLSAPDILHSVTRII